MKTPARFTQRVVRRMRRSGLPDERDDRSRLFELGAAVPALREVRIEWALIRIPELTEDRKKNPFFVRIVCHCLIQGAASKHRPRSCRREGYP